MSLKARTRSAVLVSLWLACAALVLAADPAPPQAAPVAQQPDFSPPPVPEFMLRKPAKPLTLEEMQKQADEAARRARAVRDKNTPPPSTPAKAGNETQK